MNPTEKLYYKDAYIKDFYAEVISCTNHSDVFDIVMDKTAFFPEAGGQASDHGYIDGVEVIDVSEIENIIHHYVKSPVNVNKTVHCTLNFDERFEKMQCHTAEHIASGLLHSLYGIENVGFHLGAVEVTLDTSELVSAEQLREVERLANEAIYKNAKVSVVYPSESELSSLEYRSKLELTENVRIVNIEGYDSCACCAPHVAYAGEIGRIKFLDSVKHKGGSRIRMLAGCRAYAYETKISAEASAVSVLLSAPVTDIAAEVSKLLASKSALDYKISQMGKEMAVLLADSLPKAEGNAVVFYPMLDADSMREFINKAACKIGGTLVGLIGDEGSFRYIIYSVSPDFQRIVKQANEALGGKGGGRAPMASGSFTASLEAVKKHFGAV